MESTNTKVVSVLKSVRLLLDQLVVHGRNNCAIVAASYDDLGRAIELLEKGSKEECVDAEVHR